MYKAPKKTFFELTIEECYELYHNLGWVLTYADGKFAGMRIEK